MKNESLKDCKNTDIHVIYNGRRYWVFGQTDEFVLVEYVYGDGTRGPLERIHQTDDYTIENVESEKVESDASADYRVVLKTALARNGGCTVKTANNRYIVSLENHELTLHADNLNSRDKSDRRSFIADIRSWFEANYEAAETLGAWWDGDVLYLDSNVSFDRLATAIEFGRSQNQLAIYDTVTDTVINC